MIKKKILFLSPYPVNKAPSQRLKYEQYYEYFEKAGYEITTSSFMSEDLWKIVYKRGYYGQKIYFTFIGYLRRIYDLYRLKNFDLIYVHLWVTPLGPPIYEWILSKRTNRFIYDIDDLIFLIPKSKSNPFLRFLKSRNKSILLMKKAKHVITCTPYLDSFVNKYNLNSTDISSTIDTEKYVPKNNYDIVNRLPVLGWSGSYSTSKYLYLLKDVLLKLSKEFEFKLLVIGDESFNLDGIRVEALPWGENTEVEDLSKIDIGLYPLPNEEWVLGKSGLKALQYMALGIPTIATAIGANFRVIEHNISGMLVNNEQEWFDTLKLLLQDQSKRKSLGINGQLRVRKMYSINATAPVYLSILKAVETL